MELERRVPPVRGTGNWVIYHDGGRWWNVPYVVVSPHGIPMGVAYTGRGARKVLARARARLAVDQTEYVVHEEAADG